MTEEFFQKYLELLPIFRQAIVINSPECMELERELATTIFILMQEIYK